jgi:hypothetical protein
MRIMFKTERYCHKCHKIRNVNEFNKITKNFRISSECKQHRGKQK